MLFGIGRGGAAGVNSYVVLKSALFPLAENQWNSQFDSGNKFAGVAKNCLYNTDDDVVINADSKFSDALDFVETNDSRYFFALFAAEQDYEVAKALAYGYEDFSAKDGEEYIYFVRVNSQKDEYQNLYAISEIGLSNTPEYPAPTEFSGESKDSVIVLRWLSRPIDRYYSTYDIERSTDGVNFTNLNDGIPVLSSVEDRVPDYSFYRDSLPDNSNIFYYRICGRTYFGGKGPYSEVLEIKGTPGKLRNFYMDFKVFLTDNEVSFDWSGFNDELEDKIEGFNIYRSNKSEFLTETVNPTLLASSVRTYQDTDPMSSGYYQLEAVDVNGHSYRSQVKLVQLLDSIPPDAPVGLSGTFPNSGTLVLSWMPNTDEDVANYHVFAANSRNAEFTQISHHSVNDTSFVYNIDPNFAVDSIFIQVLAADLRDNYSEKSEILALARPDVVPPSNPLLHHVVPTPEGIELGYQFSESDDVVRHEFQRKEKQGGAWKTILSLAPDEVEKFELDNNNGKHLYLDKDPLKRRDYVYRLIAIDDSENVASSKLMYVRPYDDGMRGQITQFRASPSYQPIDWENIPNPDGHKHLVDIIATYNAYGTVNHDDLQPLVFLNVITNQEYKFLITSKPYEIISFLKIRFREIWGSDLKPQIELSWSYDAENDQLVDYQIFRSVKGSALALYKTIPKEELSGNYWVDDDTKAGRRYVYQIMARHLGGGFSKRSRPVMVKLPK